MATEFWLPITFCCKIPYGRVPVSYHYFRYLGRKTDRRTDRGRYADRKRQAGSRQADRQTARQIGGQAGRQTDRSFTHLFKNLIDNWQLLNFFLICFPIVYPVNGSWTIVRLLTEKLSEVIRLRTEIMELPEVPIWTNLRISWRI